MVKQRIIDSHIHLWPKETCSEEFRSWMTPGNPLVEEHLLANYIEAAEQNNNASNVNVEGVVYVETDVRYDDPTSGAHVTTWAKGPLDEIAFLRSVGEGKYGDRAAKLLVGVVPWAPMDQPLSVLREYLECAERRAGPEFWRRLKGFRFLLQFITDEDRFAELVLGDNFITNLKELGQRGFSFDVGVDQRSGGTWQLDLVAQAMEKAHEGVHGDEKKVAFIADHLCKPAFQDAGTSFEQWRVAISRMSKLCRTYIKLSGAFSELPERLTNVEAIVNHIRPWVRHALDCFGTERVMFGSDWPVCNVSGPLGEHSWVAWKDVVLSLLESELNDEEREYVMYKTAKNAYRLG